MPSNDAIDSEGDGGICPSASLRGAARPLRFATGCRATPPLRCGTANPRIGVLQDPVAAIAACAPLVPASVLGVPAFQLARDQRPSVARGAKTRTIGSVPRGFHIPPSEERSNSRAGYTRAGGIRPFHIRQRHISPRNPLRAARSPVGGTSPRMASGRLVVRTHPSTAYN